MNMRWPNSLQPQACTKADCSIIERFRGEVSAVSPFMMQAPTWKQYCIISTRCAGKDRVSPLLFRLFFFFHIYCQEAASADSSAFWVESLDCTGGKVSSQSNPLQWSNNKSKKLQSCEAEIINHLIYGDNAEWENSKHKQTLSRCWGKLHGTGDTGS